MPRPRPPHFPTIPQQIRGGIYGFVHHTGLHHSIDFWAYECFFHPMLARLLGCGTAKIPSQGPPVPPWPAANTGEQNRLLFQLLQFATNLSKVNAASANTGPSSSMNAMVGVGCLSLHVWLAGRVTVTQMRPTRKSIFSKKCPFGLVSSAFGLIRASRIDLRCLREHTTPPFPTFCSIHVCFPLT